MAGGGRRLWSAVPTLSAAPTCEDDQSSVVAAPAARVPPPPPVGARRKIQTKIRGGARCHQRKGGMDRPADLAVGATRGAPSRSRRTREFHSRGEGPGSDHGWGQDRGTIHRVQQHQAVLSSGEGKTTRAGIPSDRESLTGGSQRSKGCQRVKKCPINVVGNSADLILAWTSAAWRGAVWELGASSARARPTAITTPRDAPGWSGRRLRA